MPNTCCVPLCKGNYKTGPKVSCFAFPRDDELRRKWLKSIRRADFKPTDNSRVCIEHFKEEDIERKTCFVKSTGEVLEAPLKRPRLKKDAIPSIFSYNIKASSTCTRREDPEDKKRRFEYSMLETAIKESIALVEEHRMGQNVSNIEDLYNKIQDADLHDWIFTKRNNKLYFIYFNTDNLSAKFSVCVYENLSVKILCGDTELQSVGGKKTENLKVNTINDIEDILQNTSEYIINRAMVNYPEDTDLMAKNSSKNCLNNPFERQKCCEDPLKLENADKFSFVEYSKPIQSSTELYEILIENQTNEDDNEIVIKSRTNKPNDKPTIISPNEIENSENNFKKISKNNIVVTPENSQDTIEVITIIGLESGEKENESKLEADLFGFSSKKDHPSLKKSNNEFQCFECLKKFKTMQNMLKHSKETGHIIPPRFKCEVCSKAFKTSKVFLAHSKRHTKENPKSICDICGATILTRNLSRHVQSHSGTSNFCQYCEKSFTQKGSLLFHIRSTHEGVSPHMLCYICGKVYARLAELNRHLNQHTDEELKNCPHRCELCRKCFTSDASLSLHHSYHKGHRKLKVKNRKPVFKKVENYNANPKLKSLRECSVCKKKISSNGFRKHVHMHEDFRPFQCSICAKKFRQHPHLKSHMNIHLGLKNHKCEYCNKQFRHMTTWITHTRMHTGETPFVCSVCNKGFYHSSTMNKHMKTHYKNRPRIRKDIKVTSDSCYVADSADKERVNDECILELN